MITLEDIKNDLGLFDIDETTLVTTLDSIDVLQLLEYLERNGIVIDPKDLFEKHRLISDFLK